MTMTEHKTPLGQVIEVGQTVRAFHPRRFGVVNEGTVTKIGLRHVSIDFGPLLGGTLHVPIRDVLAVTS
jgi:small-conductance mechanosensitive channel